ncbi:MAG: protein kinase, partial [Acidobacteriota bacterium]
MDEQWPQVEALFVEALARAPAARSAFVERACGDDLELRRQVESLLAADREAGTFLDQPALGSAPDLPQPDSADLPEGTALGRYRILRPLGQGGMATVYLAVREQDYQQQVAVKVFAHGRQRRDLVRRFEHERQILASLEHPSIARLLDGGSTPEGLPYLVMERVEGVPIDLYCDRRDLDLDARIDLFRRLAEAVHYAHQRLVVHRDLKPSNILVTASGTPKLLDFGIAKLVAPDALGEDAFVTADGQRLMTPAYASPEQVRGDAITTASDVYSMGVLLYRLLTGRLPYQLDGAISDYQRAILETDPEKPSVAVLRPAEPAEATDPESSTTRDITTATQ